MKLRQLQYVHEVVRCGLNVSKAAQVLHTSQPGISHQIRLLEEELGMDIFERDKSRLVALSPRGEIIVGHISSVLTSIRNIAQTAQSDAPTRQQKLSIVGTHTQIRYILPDVLKAFSDTHPEVKLSIRRCDVRDVSGALDSGEADIALAPIEGEQSPDIVYFDYRQFRNILIVPAGHRLLQMRRITIQDIGKYPLIMHPQSDATRGSFLQSFTRFGISPQVVLSSVNSDTIKACVESGLGIAILPEFVFSPGKDVGLRALDTGTLFPPYRSKMALSRKRPLRPAMIEFIQLLAPSLKLEKLLQSLRFENTSPSRKIRSVSRA